MAATPTWKVYTAAGEYVAACKHAEDAGAIAALHGTGSEIRHGHRSVCWIEGADGHASESLDQVAATCYRRLAMTNAEHRQDVAIAREMLADGSI